MEDKGKTTKSNKRLDDILMGLHGGADDGEGDKTRLTPSEKVAMIEKAFADILARKPDTRDLNYYKYSSLSEEDIRTELVNGKEHKELIQYGREFRKVKNLLDTTKTRVRVLESEIKDQEESTKQLNVLLKEKNAHIEELKKKLKNPFEHKCYNPKVETDRSEKVVEEKEESSTFSKVLGKFLSIFSSE